MDKYTEFKATAAGLKVMAFLIVALAGVAAVSALFSEPGLGAKLYAFLQRAAVGALGYALLLATSEAIYVLIDIEFNTRRSRELLEQRGKDAA